MLVIVCQYGGVVGFTIQYLQSTLCILCMYCTYIHRHLLRGWNAELQSRLRERPHWRHPCECLYRQAPQVVACCFNWDASRLKVLRIQRHGRAVSSQFIRMRRLSACSPPSLRTRLVDSKKKAVKLRRLRQGGK